MAIYNGTQKIDMSGVDKVYVGTQLVYQKITKQVTGIAVDYDNWPTGNEYFSPVTFLSIAKTCAWYQPTGSTFNYPGRIIATYDDGSTEDVTSQCTYGQYNMNQETGNTGYGLMAWYTYNGTTVQLPTTTVLGSTVYSAYVLVKKVASSLAISGYNTIAYKNDAFNFGGTATVTYTDGTTADVTSNANTTYSGYNMSTAGTYTVNVNYKTYVQWSLSTGGARETASVSQTYQLTVSEWKTLWSGNITRTRDATGSVVTTDIVDLSSQGYSGNKTFRITCSATSVGSYNYYTQNGSQVSSWTSPFTTTINTSNPGSATTNVVGLVRGGSSANAYWYVNLHWQYSTFKFQFQDGKSIFGTPSNSSASMTVTKIEEYIP